MGQNQMKYNELTPAERRVIIEKGTERPFSGRYYDHKEAGVYTCKRCGAPLYRSEDKFDSGCGWPSFDDEIEGAVKHQPDADSVRTEILCTNCGAHLGHVFTGEEFTKKNIRHCVNSISMNFTPEDQIADILPVYASLIDLPENPKNEENMSLKSERKAYFAAGCFWGVEHYFKQAPGVLSTQVGYTGGRRENPTYKEVSSGKTGHKEAIEVVYNPTVTSFEELVKLFFEIHDFTQTDGQGPDLGEQYLSYIFTTDEDEQKVARNLIAILEKMGYDVATKIESAMTFWKAEEYHQDYYAKTGKTPYCHFRREIFE